MSVDFSELRTAPGRAARQTRPGAGAHPTGEASGRAAGSGGRRLGRLGRALAAALLVNALLFAALATLNRPAPPPRGPAEEPVTVSVMQLRDRSDPAQEAAAEPQAMVEIEEAAAPVEPLEATLPPVTLSFAAASPIQLEAPAFEVPAVDLPLRREEPVPAAEPTPREAAPRPQGAPGGALEGDAIDEPPRELGSTRPAYPRLPLRRGIEGRVELRLLIDREGHVERYEVIRVEGHQHFRQAVLEVVEELRFTPPRHRGEPVRVWTRKVFRFVIPR